MFVLILDTETTGLFPRGGHTSPFNPSAQIRGNNNKSTTQCLYPSTQRGSGHCVVGSAPLPYAVQVSYAIIDTSSPVFPIVEDYDAIIRISDETPLPAESVAIHGITREMIQAKGVPIEHVLSILQRSLDTYDVQLIVGHNIAFDLRVLETERGRQAPPSTPLCKGGKGGKAPSPSSSPDPTSTPEGATSTPFNPSAHKGEGATSAHYAVLQTPLCPSAQIKNSPIPYSNTLKGLRSLCTARESVGVCNLRVDSMYGGTYLKFGKLGQVFETLFKARDAARGVDMKVFEKYMHNSRVDVLMCARVYVWLCYSVDVFDAWYREMQNYADEDFINVDDAHLISGKGEHPFETPRGAEGFKGALAAPSPRRSDRLRLKRMLVQEQGSVLVM